MDVDALKQQQREHMNASFREQTIAIRGREFGSANLLSKYIAERPLQTVLRLLGEDVSGQQVLSICAGTGEEAIALHRLGAHVLATDISESACALIAERESGLQTAVADAEHLPFQDGSFDYVMVKFGLHHLPRPMMGVYEMLRVARKGILIMEAQDSWMTRLCVLLGIAQRIEESGNFVYRFSRREMQKVCDTLFVQDIRMHTEWYQFMPFLEQHVYPYMNTRLGFACLRGLMAIGNFFFGRWGNNFICVIKKNT